MDKKGALLLDIARDAITREFGLVHCESIERLPFLEERAATFVTLMQDGQLRGCIGSLEAKRTLHEDVKANAIAAAFRDPRFSPLEKNELPTISIEVSLLSTTQRIYFKNELDALAQLVPNIDGVIFEYRHFRSTFLPQVWEGLCTPEEFMEHLKVKAGLSADFWDENVQLWRYSVTKWKES